MSAIDLLSKKFLQLLHHRFVNRYSFIALTALTLSIVLAFPVVTPWVKINWIQGAEYRERVKNATSNLEMQKNPPSRMLNTEKLVIYKTIKNGWHDHDLEKVSEEWNKTPEGEYPKSLSELLLLSEDKDFSNHNGISNWALLRAIINITKKGSGSGSTITQQIARKIVKTDYSKASYLEDKIEEQTIAKLLEERYVEIYRNKQLAKNAILLTYMNQVNIGVNVYGFRDAARVYFNQQPHQLSLSQQVKLVAMLSRPEIYTCPQSKGKVLVDGFNRTTILQSNDAKLRKISINLLSQLRKSVKEKNINFQVESYKDSTFNVTPFGKEGFTNFCTGRNQASYFATKVEQEIKQISADPNNKKVKKVYMEGGFGIDVTLDSTKQSKAESILKDTVEAYKKNFGISDGAIVLMETNTGKVRVMVGIGKEDNSPIMQARSPASTFKIFTYLTALEKNISPNKYYSCGPFERPNRQEKDTCRYKKEERINLFQALARSENVIAWRLAEEVGRDSVIETAKKMGLKEETEDNTKLDSSFNGIIGQGETKVSLMKIMQAYSTIANDGIEVKPKYIESIFDTKQCTDIKTRYKSCGKKIYKANIQGSEKINPKISNTLTKMLQGVIYDEKGTGSLARLNPKHKNQGKRIKNNIG